MYDPHLHLLIDDCEIDYRRGLTRFIESPQRLSMAPVLEPEKPWEGESISLWGSVYREAGEFRMWYLGNGGPSGPYATSVCYASSADGIHWTRGAFEHVSHPTADRNNLVFREEGAPELRRCHPFTVLIDPEETDGDRRFKFLGFFTDVAGGRGYVAAFSPDGIYWTPHTDRIPLPRGDRTSVMQDFKRGGFLMASRGDHRSRDRGAGHHTKRDIAISRSEDFIEWSPARRIFEGDDDDPPGTEFYGMPMFLWGNQYIGLLEYYDPTNEILNVQLSSSRDGERWERACSRQTYFDRGSSDAWDCTWAAFAMSPPQVVGDEMRFWYTGRTVAHRRPDGMPLSSALGAARAPRDRFAGLRSGPDGGEMTTSWIRVGGPRLLLNIGASCGPVSVAVTGEDGGPIPGFSHEDWDVRVESGVDVEATWKGRNLSELVEQSVRLHFRITYSTLYAYRFA